MKARRLAWLTGVFYIMGCLLLGVQFDPTNRNQWLMAASLGFVVAVTWLVYPLIRKSVLYRQKLLDELHLGQINEALGIKKIYPNGVSRKVIRDNLTRQDIKSIKILANSAKTYLIHYAAEAWSTLLDSHEVKIQVLIAQEGSSFVEEAAKLESINVSRGDPISPSIIEVKKFLAEKTQKSNRRDFIELRQFHTQIRANLLIIDDKWCWYTPHLPPVSPMNSLALELIDKETDQGKCLLRTCLDYFQVVWSESEKNRVILNS